MVAQGLNNLFIYICAVASQPNFLFKYKSNANWYFKGTR